MAKDEKRAVVRRDQSARWAVRIGPLRMTARARSTPAANITLGLGAALVFAGISLLVRTVAAARRRR